MTLAYCLLLPSRWVTEGEGLEGTWEGKVLISGVHFQMTYVIFLEFKKTVVLCGGSRCNKLDDGEGYWSGILAGCLYYHRRRKKKKKDAEIIVYEILEQNVHALYILYVVLNIHGDTPRVC